MNKQLITLKKLSALVVDSAVNGTVDNRILAASMNADMMQLGYVMNKTLFDIVSQLSESEIVELHKEAIDNLRTIVGADVEYNPMYPNFPTQVMNADELELFANALVHYWTAGEWQPNYVKDNREFFPENVEFKQIGSVLTEKFEDVFTSLLSTKESLSEEDRDIVMFFLNNEAKFDLRYPESIEYKETLCLVAAHKLNKYEDISDIVSTATDVLRVITHLSEGDISLAQSTKFKSLPRAKRKLLVSALEKVINVDDVMRHESKWNKAFHCLHVGDYSDSVYKIAEYVRDNSKKHKTFNAKVEAFMSDAKYKEALKLLKTRPSELARRLDHLLRVSNESEDVLKAFESVVNDIPTRISFQLLGHLKSRMTNTENVVVFPKGQTQKAVLVERNFKSLSLTTVNRLMTAITDSLKNRFSDLDDLGKVYIDPALKEAPLPTAQRSASTAIDTVARGTRMDIGDKNTLRLFIYWKGQDIDLSATFHDEDFNTVQQVSYTNLRSAKINAYHSGDITRAPRGASEFIDFDIEEAVKAGVRYVTMNVLVYSGPNFSEHEVCYAGWMTREAPNSNEVFEPKTVEQKIDVRSETRNVVPVIFDVVDRKAVWVDLSTGRSRSYRGGNNVESNKASIEQVMKSICEMSKNRATLYDLFEQHALSRGKLVDTVEEADTVYSFDRDATVSPRDINTINEKYVA